LLGEKQSNAKLTMEQAEQAAINLSNHLS
jgi:hypothetical protein